MSKGNSRKRVGPEEQRVQLSLRVKRELYDRARATAKAKGFLSVAEWARSVVLASIEK